MEAVKYLSGKTSREVHGEPFEMVVFNKHIKSMFESEAGSADFVNIKVDGNPIKITGKVTVIRYQKPDMAEPVTVVLTGVKEYTMKEELCFGHMGNGIVVWDHAQEENNDYVTVAHISPDRTVKYYRELSQAAVFSIEDFARTENPTISVSQDTPVFKEPAHA